MVANLPSERMQVGSNLVYVKGELTLQQKCMNWQNGSFLVTTDKQKMDTAYIHWFLSTQSYWSQNIPRKIVEKSMEGSLCFGLFEKDRQIGFARVITDKATFAYLADVFIDEAFRGRGLGKWLMEIIMGHSDLQALRAWLLTTRDAHSLYAQFGFKPLDEPGRIMRKHNPDVYPKNIS